MKNLLALLIFAAVLSVSQALAQDTTYMSMTIGGVELISAYTYSDEEGALVRLYRTDGSTDLIPIDNSQIAKQLIENEYLFVPCSLDNFKKIFGEPNYEKDGYAYETHLFREDAMYYGCWLSVSSRNGKVTGFMSWCH